MIKFLEDDLDEVIKYLESTLNTILGHIVELGIKLVSDPFMPIAWVSHSVHVNIDGDNVTPVFNYEPKIYVNMLKILLYVEDFNSCIANPNNQFEDIVLVCELQTVVLHEARHIWQFENYGLTSESIDIIDNGDSWGAVLNSNAEQALELDAISFSYMNKNIYPYQESKHIADIVQEIIIATALHELYEKSGDQSSANFVEIININLEKLNKIYS